jgi:phage terminase large subunit-like protein
MQTVIADIAPSVVVDDWGGCPPLIVTPVPVADIERGDGDDVIDTLEALCTVSKDGFAARAGDPLVLRSWQKTLLRYLFARRPDGRRRHRTALIGMPRKNGKSAIGSGLALDGLLFDGEGAEVYSAAAEREQARIVFAEAKRMIMVGFPR